MKEERGLELSDPSIIRSMREVKRVLFIQESSTVEEEGVIFPLGIAYLMAALPRGIETRVIDLNLYRDYRDGILRAGSGFDPDLIAFSVRNIKIARPAMKGHLSTLHQLAASFQGIRSIFPDVPLFAGGCAFSLYADILMKRFPEIDVGFFGEGETSLAAALSNPGDLRGVRGLYLRGEDGRVHFTGHPERPVDFARLPAPRREGFEMERYLSVPNSIGVQTKRGCAFRCIHCSDLHLLGRFIRRREPKDVVQELLYLKRRYDLKNFMFVDQCFNNPLSHAKEICEEILREGVNLRWVAWFNEKNIDLEFLKLLKRAGCEYLSFSPDSVDDRILERLGKEIRREDIERVLFLAGRAGLPVSMNFFLPNPGEDLLSMSRLFTFILKSRLKMGRLFKIHGLFIVPIRIYPHTKLRDHAVEAGFIEEENDLIEPVFFAPFPMYQVASLAMAGINTLFRLKSMRGPFRKKREIS